MGAAVVEGVHRRRRVALEHDVLAAHRDGDRLAADLGSTTATGYQYSRRPVAAAS